MYTLKQANVLQAQAIAECNCKDVIAFIERNGQLFRDILNRHYASYGILPTVEELLWLASELLRHDIREED